MATFTIIAEDPPEGLVEEEDWTKKPQVPFVGWLILDPEDLGIQFASEDEDVPGWLDYELGEIGWDILGLGCYDAETWALKEGIAPGQPFQVRIDPPHYHQDYWGEWDVDYEWDIIDKAPFTNDMTLAAWLAWFRDWVKVPFNGDSLVVFEEV